MTLKKRPVLLLFLFLPFLILPLQAQEPSYLTLEDAIQKALKQNNLLRADDFALQKAKWDKRRAWSQLLPSVNFNTRYTWIDDSSYALRDFSRYFRSNDPGAGFGFDIPQTVFQKSWYTSFDVNMTLFNGVIWNGISYAGAAQELARSKLSSSQNAVVFQVIYNYLNALYARDILQLQKEYLKLSELNYQKAKRLQEAGRYSKLEALRWKVDLQQQKSIVSQSASGVRSSLASLARVTASSMNTPVRIETQLPEKLISESTRLQNLPDAALLKMIDLSRDELLKANAALAAAKSSEEMSRLFYRSSYSKFLPNVNMNYSYAWQENNTTALDDYSPQMLTLNFSWPLFTGFQDFSEAKVNYYDYKRSQEQFKDQLQNLHFKLTETVNKLINLKTQIELSAANVELSESNYEIAASQKEKGLVSNIDFIDAKLNFQNAGITQLKNRYDFISGMVELYYLLGKLELLL